MKLRSRRNLGFGKIPKVPFVASVSKQVETPVVGRIFTRGCPACESGMVAPGI